MMFRDWCFLLLLVLDVDERPGNTGRCLLTHNWMDSATTRETLHAQSPISESLLPSFWSLTFSSIELQILGRAAYCLGVSGLLPWMVQLVAKRGVIQRLIKNILFFIAVLCTAHCKKGEKNRLCSFGGGKATLDWDWRNGNVGPSAQHRSLG